MKITRRHFLATAAAVALPLPRLSARGTPFIDALATEAQRDLARAHLAFMRAPSNHEVAVRLNTLTMAMNAANGDIDIPLNAARDEYVAEDPTRKRPGGEEFFWEDSA
jgi:hypothetical protein